MKQAQTSFEALCKTVEALRGPHGCPWDKEQTHQSLTPYALEEAFELVEAIESNDQREMIEELGDCLLQVVLHAEIARQENRFDIRDVCEAINQKMIRRHPHVFANVKVKDTEEVWANWAKIKNDEKAKKPKTDSFDIPIALPALQRAEKIGRKTNSAGFDWKKSSEVMEKVREELAELQEAMAQNERPAITHELGDLLFSLAQLGRHLGIDAEKSLREANRRFESRYFAMQNLAREQNQKFTELSPEQKEKLWAQVKAATKARCK